MLPNSEQDTFPLLNSGYNATFQSGKLSIGLVVPLESYVNSPVPEMVQHVQRVKLAESLGFSAVWLRDVPFNVPSFGDAGQVYDPFVYLGFLAGQTHNITLGVSSIILPLRHPAHIAKAAASVDVLSGGRLVLGVASGDRPTEYPALNVPFDQRAERFRSSFEYIRYMGQERPEFENLYGRVNQEAYDNGIDMLPKPVNGQLPLMITGGSQQDSDWIARNGDGWMIYPRSTGFQAHMVSQWRERVMNYRGVVLPVMQPLYFDLNQNADASPEQIHLGFRAGSNYLLEYLCAAREIGINHIALNLRFNKLSIESTLEALADKVLPEFH